MKVYILGHDGNMGQRYRAILKYLGHEVAGFDKRTGKLGDFEPSEADRLMVTTPTASHLSDLMEFIPLGKPILCEKPISKDRQGLNELLTFAESHHAKLAMVSQYDYMPFSQFARGLTHYDYFKHGGDGIYWDCINVIYHANGEIHLGEKSPYWKCFINGDRLQLSDIDQAYIDMMSKWLDAPWCEANRIWKAHEKVRQLMEAQQCKQS